MTISYNQGAFLKQCIESVLGQEYDDLEYIIVDAGSTDGSREIIAKYVDRLSGTVLEPDDGPADGLRKGFLSATGAVFGFLNADDLLLPGALRQVGSFFASHPSVDVMSGHCHIIDASDRVLRTSYSDRFTLRRYAYGAAVLMQPSTFFRAGAFERSGGFNTTNRTNWDGELFVAMAESGARFELCSTVLSAYRVHASSITGAAALDAEIKSYNRRMFRHIIGRDMGPGDSVVALALRCLKHLSSPRSTYQRLRYGRIYGRAA